MSFVDMRDTEDWSFRDDRIDVLGMVLGELNLDDPIETRYYLKKVLDVIWDDYRADWYWRALNLDRI